MTAGFEFHELVPRPRGVRYVVRRDDFVAIANGSRPAAELLHLLITDLGVGLGRIADDHEREIEEEILGGAQPERAAIHPRFTQRELAERLHCSRNTIAKATATLERAGLVDIGRREGETADNAYVYVVNVGRVREAVTKASTTSGPPTRPRIRLVDADAQKSTTGSAKVSNRKRKGKPTMAQNSADLGAEVSQDVLKTEPPLDGENYGDSLSTTEREPPLSPIPISDEPVREELVRKAGVPKALRALDLERLEGLDASYDAGVAAARRWADGDAGGLLLLGGPGRGKTTIAAAACWKALARREPLAWMFAPELPRILNSNFDDASLRKLTETLNRGCGLVLDDLEPMEGKRAARQVSAAVSARVQSGRPLLITSGLGADELESEFGERLVSRLVGHCEIAVLQGPNLHKLIAERRAA